MKDISLQGIGMTSRRTRDRLIVRLREQNIHAEKVLAVIKETPRHIFIDEALAHRAYEDTALPICFKQTISQPYIVARMTEVLLAGGPLTHVLEVGTGSGYQTAVLAQLVEQVFSVERIKSLQDKARYRLHQIGLKNIRLQHTDGGLGWPSKAPFDGIIVTAAAPQIPEELLAQLTLGGRLVIPVGQKQQQLTLVVRVNERDYETLIIENVKFVPLLAGTIQ